MTIRNGYEVSSESAIRHWEFNYARLENVTPTETQPFAVTSLLAGTQITGTVLTINAGLSLIVGDVTHSMVYLHNVRNVLTYAANVENTWGVIAEGDPIYYDGSAVAPADVFLSTSPLDQAGGANALFGYAVLQFAADTSLPTTTATASTESLGVMQVGV